VNDFAENPRFSNAFRTDSASITERCFPPVAAEGNGQITFSFAE